MRRFLELALVGVLFAAPAAVAAQTCGGMASFAAGPVRVGGGVGIAENVRNYNANLNAGSPLGPFAGVSIARAEDDRFDNSSTIVGLSGGYSFELNPRKTVKFCPIASFNSESGPDGGNVDRSAHSLAFGGSFGGLVHTSPTLTFVPFVSAMFVARSASTRVGNGARVTSSDDFALLTFGGGFVVSRTVSIQPAIGIPVGIDAPGRDDAIFSLGIGLNFGSSGTTTPRTATPRR